MIAQIYNPQDTAVGFSRRKELQHPSTLSSCVVLLRKPRLKKFRNDRMECHHSKSWISNSLSVSAILSAFLSSIIISFLLQGQICGLCGNYDGNGINDFTTRSQSVVENILEFGNSWKVSSTCPDAYSIKDPCSTNPYRKSWSEKQCSIINSNVFAACHSQVLLREKVAAWRSGLCVSYQSCFSVPVSSWGDRECSYT